MNVKRVFAALVLAGATLTLSGPAHADPGPGGASSVETEAHAAEEPASEASSDEGITTIEIPGDAAAGNASGAPKRDSHISLTNGVLNGGKHSLAGVTGIDNKSEN